MLSNLFTTLGWTRDDLKWTLGVLASVIVGLATLGNSVTDYGIPINWLPYLRLGALIVGLVSAKMATSGLVGRTGAVLLAIIMAGSLSACASLPIKDQAVNKLAATERLLGTAQDTERALCSPAADKLKPITHCDGAAAVAAGLTDARHQAIARAFVQAFEAQSKAAVALKAWRAGEPAPVGIAEITADAQQVLAVIRQLSGSPDVQKVVVSLTNVLDSVTAIQAALGGK